MLLKFEIVTKKNLENRTGKILDRISKYLLPNKLVGLVYNYQTQYMKLAVIISIKKHIAETIGDMESDLICP